MALKVQSVIFRRDKFNQTTAKQWLKKHNYMTQYYGKPVDITANYLRYRQDNPDKFKIYVNKQISDGIILVLGAT